MYDMGMINPREVVGLAADHDGTFTDIVAEFDHYNEIAQEFIARELGISELVVEAIMVMKIEEIMESPEKFGWVVDGRTVAPMADQYLIVRQAMLMLSEELDVPIEKKEQLSERVFAECAPKLGSYYKEDAQRVLKELVASTNLYVVTNSSTIQVEKKLRTILSEEEMSRLKVVGGAKKMVVDPSWQGVVPEGAYQGMAGFPDRGVYLQRKAYFAVLSSVFGPDLSKARMMGDIGEMDLAMIDYLGGKTGLVLSRFSLPWEVAYWTDGSARRRASENLGEIASFLVNQK